MSASLREPADQTVRAPARIVGELVYFGLFLLLLSGRFSLSRISGDLPEIDIRWLGLLVLVAATFFWQAGLRDRPRVASTGPLAWAALMFGLFALWMILSSAWVATDVPSVAASDELAILLGVTLLGAFVLSRLSVRSLEAIWAWSLVAALIYLVAALIAGPGAQGRYAAFGGGPNVFVRVMIIGVIATVWLAHDRRRLWPLAVAPFLVIAALLSGSRGGLVSAAVIGLVSAWPLSRRLGAARTLFALIGLATGAFLINYVLNGALVEYVQTRYVEQTIQERYISSRDVLAQSAIDLWASSPIVGVGVGGYAASQEQETGIEYPHNLVLATMAEGGAVGGLLLMLAVAVPLVQLLRRRPLVPHELACVAGACFVLGAAQFSGDYYDSRLIWFFLLCALAHIQHRGSPESRAEELVVAPGALSAASTPRSARSRRTPRTS